MRSYRNEDAARIARVAEYCKKVPSPTEVTAVPTGTHRIMQLKSPTGESVPQTSRPHGSGIDLALAMVLIAAAGWVDAVAFLHFEQLFVSFMSGNSTKLAIDLQQGQWSRVLVPSLAIGCFVLGAFAGSLLTSLTQAYRTPAVLSFVIFLLIVALLLPRVATPSPFTAMPLAVAMGAQNAALNSPGGLGTALTYITGTLVRLGESLAQAVCKTRDALPWYFHAAIWCALIIGAAAGALLHASWGLDALTVVASVLGIIAVVTAGQAYRQERQPA